MLFFSSVPQLSRSEELSEALLPPVLKCDAACERLKTNGSPPRCHGCKTAVFRRDLYLLRMLLNHRFVFKFQVFFPSSSFLWVLDDSSAPQKSVTDQAQIYQEGFSSFQCCARIYKATSATLFCFNCARLLIHYYTASRFSTNEKQAFRRKKMRARARATHS